MSSDRWMVATTVVNKYYESYDVDITRGTIFGNPHRIGYRGMTREDVVRKCMYEHAQRIVSDKEFRRAVLALRGKRLGCVCKPKSCHGDFLARVATLGVIDLQVEERERPPVMEFQGEWRFLSNFWRLNDPPLMVDGLEYPSVEHFYQAQRAVLPIDRSLIATAGTPGEAKRMARHVETVSDWNDVKVSVMVYGLLEKFTQSPSLGDRLIATGDALLIEGNKWHDNFWGRCVCGKCEGFGTNLLGEVLMYIRSLLPIFRAAVQDETTRVFNQLNGGSPECQR